jgi:hypothetical protein
LRQSVGGADGAWQFKIRLAPIVGDRASTGGDNLDNWTKEVKADKVPRFGAQLAY